MLLGHLRKMSRHRSRELAHAVELTERFLRVHGDEWDITGDLTINGISNDGTVNVGGLEAGAGSVSSANVNAGSGAVTLTTTTGSISSSTLTGGTVTLDGEQLTVEQVLDLDYGDMLPVYEVIGRAMSWAVKTKGGVA